MDQRCLTTRRLRSLIVIVSFAALTTHADAQRQARRSMVGHGGEDGLRRALENATDYIASDVGVAKAFRGLADLHGITIWLDRRIDPNISLTIRQTNTSLAKVISDIAIQSGAKVCYVGPVIYVGPATVTDRLATIAAIQRKQMESLPANRRRALLDVQSSSWESLVVPRELVQQFAAECDLEIANLAKLPHDLWAAKRLPPLAMIDRFTIVLAGFNMTLDVADDGHTAELVALPQDAAITHSYTGVGGAETLKQLRQQFPAAAVHRRGTGIEVRGSYEDHIAIKRLLRGTRQTPTGPRREAEKRYTLTVENKPIGAILRQVMESAELQVEVTAGARAKLRELVSFQVRDVPLEKLLEVCLQRHQLSFELTASRLTITSD